MSAYTTRWLARAKKMNARALAHAVDQLRQYGLLNDDQSAFDLAESITQAVHRAAFHERVMNHIGQHMARNYPQPPAAVSP